MAYVEYAPFANQKLKLMAKKLPDANFPASLKMDIYRGNPQLSMLTGYKKTSNVPTTIRANFEPKTAGILCGLIDYLADQPKPTDKPITAEVEILQGKDRDLVSKIVVGLDTKGAMFISLLDMKNSSAPIIQFFFGQDYYHPVKLNNVEKDESWTTVSRIAAKEWARRARHMWYTDMIVNPPVEGNSTNSDNDNNNNKDDSYTGPSDADMPW